MGHSYTLAELAERVGAELRGDAEHRISGVSTLRNAGPQHASFLTNRRYAKELAATRAGVVILAAADAEACPSHLLITDNPHAAFARVATLFAPEERWPAGVHPTAVIDAEARIAPDASVGAHCAIAEGAVIEAGARIGPGCVVGRGAYIGAQSTLIARVTVGPQVRIGKRVVLHPGVVVGADGFGFAQDQGAWIKVPQLGSVVIEDDVDVGANTTIDRGALEDTVIEQGVKIDNLVQVAHNCRIGEHTVIAGCTGIAGSTRIGRRCAIGGAVGLGGHLSVPDDVMLTGMTMVTKSLPGPGVYSSGLPAESNAQWHRTVAHVRQLPNLLRRVKALEAALKQQSAKLDDNNG